jgi:hypothetical protein
LNVSRFTIARRLREHGYNSRVAVKKPFLKEEHERKRLVFAKKYQTWDVNQWKSVLFMDEAMFTLRAKLARKIWRTKFEKYRKDCMVGTIKQDKRIKIWSCFCYAGVGNFHQINGIFFLLFE